MRALLYLAATVLVIGLAYWAYNENYATQAQLKRVDQMQRQIASLRERLGVLHAEWAYLNRPARLRDLVQLNDPSLHLIPISGGQFRAVKEIAYPRVNPRDVTAPVDLSAALPPDPLGLPTRARGAVPVKVGPDDTGRTDAGRIDVSGVGSVFGDKEGLP